MGEDPNNLTVEWQEYRNFRVTLPLDQAADLFGIRAPSDLDKIGNTIAANVFPDLVVHVVKTYVADAIEALKRVKPSIVVEREPSPGYVLQKINGFKVNDPDAPWA